jgi:hypothetical protein
MGENAMRLAEKISRLYAHEQYKDSTVQIDFDGTLCSSYGGRGLLGEPIPSGVELVKELFSMGYRIIILTANPEPDVVGQWLVKHGVPFTAVTSQKLPAVAYVDDRAVPFSPSFAVSDIIKRIQELQNG